LKVAFINSVAGFGSTGRIVVDQYNTLVENGHTAFIAYGRKMGDDALNAYRMGSTLSTLVSVAPVYLIRMASTIDLRPRSYSKSWMNLSRISFICITCMGTISM